MSGTIGRTWTRADAGQPRAKRIYSWPTEPGEVVVFPYRVTDRSPWLASTRVSNAARMVLQHTEQHWVQHVRSTPEGVRFWWTLP